MGSGKDATATAMVHVGIDSEPRQTMTVRAVGCESVIEEEGAAVPKFRQDFFGLSGPIAIGVGKELGEATPTFQCFVCPHDLRSLILR